MNSHPLIDRICRNCGEKTTGNYCAHCGQASSGGETNWRFLVSSLLSTFVGKYITDKKGTVKRYGVPETIWHTILHPGTTVEEYLAGKHQKYYGPIAIFITLSGFYLLLGQVSGQYAEPAEGWFEAGPKAYFDNITKYISYRPAVRALIQLPFLAVFSKWLLRKKLKYNYVQHLYLWTFVYIISNILLLALVGVNAYIVPLNENLQVTLNLVTRLLYGFIVLHHLMHQTWLRTMGQTLLIWLISFLMIGAAFALLEVIAAGIYYLMSSENFGTILDQILLEE